MERLGTSKPAVKCAGATLSVVLGVLLGPLGCVQLAPPPPAGAPATYLVGPPDQLEINVLPDPAIQRSVVVRPDGMISVDLVGDVRASGRTVEEIAADIQERIGRFKRGATVTVSVAQSNSTQVTVLGEVNQNNTFPLVRQTRLAEAIGLVGGVTALAARSRVRIIRNQGGETVVLDVDLDAIQAGDLRTNYQLQEGDLILVPPTYLARVGYFIQQLLFPFQPLVGAAGAVGAGR